MESFSLHLVCAFKFFLSPAPQRNILFMQGDISRNFPTAQERSLIQKGASQ